MTVLPFRDHEAVTEAWQQLVHQGWGSNARALDPLEAKVLVDAVMDGDDDVARLLHGLGRRCAREDTPLEEVTSWVENLLTVLPKRARRGVDRLEVALSLAEGWASGTLERRHPPRNGVAPLGVLHVRLAQVYDECDALHLDPSNLYALVVIDAELAHLGPHASNAARTVMAESVLSTFAGGETVAAGNGGRVLVLSPRTTELASMVCRAVSRCEQSPVLAGTWVSGWVEPVARDRRHAAGHLDDLARCGR